ncbi:hypothetical protein HMPREF9318_00472 [Streptococcus urinalis FB127-CNA-2]|uniref:Uncharacterized protein n=1 Tax=Streptococcus urinalis 2285-97 TaxID=764291 RepID=G5KG64_9STRE|nr:hypothetical protein [Streptococcus urinalis]EHJ56917.1 hypothetical protein STRUR_1225 [Streptococcus urinalis 2285-97]EKS22274.1 hypothetical protein HMPREF9318_00472 [Streptococcus urinalis FB127-CNA-2]VEF32086.1 Uncharacterised protein [Streptococcus urinalis]
MKKNNVKILDLVQLVLLAAPAVKLLKKIIKDSKTPNLKKQKRY